MKLKYMAILVFASFVVTAKAQTQAPRKHAVKSRPAPPPTDIVPDFNETPEQESLNVLGDIVYLTPYHNFVAALSYVNNSSKSDMSLAGNNYAKISNSGNAAGYSVYFGLLRDTEVSISGNYLGAGTSDTTYGIASPVNGSSAHSNSSGFSEPTFTGTYRILNQDRSALNFDVSLAYSPALENSKSGSGQSDGNNMRGGDEISAGVVISKKINPFELAGGFLFTQDGKSTSQTAGSTATSKTDAYSTMTYKVGARLDVGAGVFLLGTLQFSSVASHGGVNSSGAPSSSPAYSYSTYNIGGDYEIKKNFMVLRLLYQVASPFSSSSTIAAQKYDIQVSTSGFAGQVLMQF